VPTANLGRHLEVLRVKEKETIGKETASSRTRAKVANLEQRASRRMERELCPSFRWAETTPTWTYMVVGFASIIRLENVLMRQMVLSAAAVGTCAAEKDAMHLTLKRIMMERPSDGQTASTPLLQSVRASAIA